MQQKLRIAMISEHASPAALIGGQDAGGQNVYVDEISRHLARHGHRVDVFSRRECVDQPEIIQWAPGVRVVHLDAGPPECISKDQIWPFMPEFSRSLLRFMLHDGARYDIFHAHFWMSGWVACDLSRRLGVPVVQTFHALGMTKRRNQGANDTSPPERIHVEAEIVRNANCLIAQCPHERTELIEDYRANPERITLMPAGVNTDRFRPIDRSAARTRLGFATSDPLVVYVGRLLPRKDIRNIVRAIASLYRAGNRGETILDRTPELLVVGGESADPDPELTPEIGALQTLATELGVRNLVHFTGQVEPDQLRHYYGAADVTVTTPWYEPFGLTPLEAMACGRPVIGSAVGGLTYTIEEGRTGFLVPPRDPQALARRIELVLCRPELADWMGDRARQRVEQRFTWETVARSLSGIYARLTTRRQPVVWLPEVVEGGLSDVSGGYVVQRAMESD